MPAEEFDASSSWMLLYATASTTVAKTKEQEQNNQALTISTFSLTVINLTCCFLCIFFNIQNTTWIYVGISWRYRGYDQGLITRTKVLGQICAFGALGALVHTPNANTTRSSAKPYNVEN